MNGPILIIDADEVERRVLSRALKNGCSYVLEATSGVEGLFRVLDDDPILIFLAEEVPPLEATDLITVLKRLTAAPLIIIGNGNDTDEVAALEDGADFYARRPISNHLILARVRALLRRSPRRTASSHVNHTGAPAAGLTRTESRLLVCLAAQGGRPVPAHQLAAAMWGTPSSLGAVKFYIWRLRRKLDPASGLSVDVLRGVGYRLKRTDTHSFERLLAV